MIILLITRVENASLMLATTSIFDLSIRRRRNCELQFYD